MEVNPLIADKESLSLARLEQIPYCNGEECHAYQLCTFVCKDTDVGVARCEVMRRYLQSTAVDIYGYFKDTLNEPQIFRIARHLLPLYKILCRLQIDELGVESAVYVTSHGKRLINPVFKEIRDTVRAIESVWASVGISDPAVKTPEFEEEEEKLLPSTTAMRRSSEAIEKAIRRKLQNAEAIY